MCPKAHTVADPGSALWLLVSRAMAASPALGVDYVPAAPNGEACKRPSWRREGGRRGEGIGPDG